jgi:hypothetical protein
VWVQSIGKAYPRGAAILCAAIGLALGWVRGCARQNDIKRASRFDIASAGQAWSWGVDSEEAGNENEAEEFGCGYYGGD